MTEESFPSWSHSVEEVAAHHKTDLKRGLTSEQVEEQRKIYGYNELTAEEPTPLWKLVLAQFDDSLVKILLLAAFVSFMLAYVEGIASDNDEGLRAYVEPAVILLILVLNAFVGVWQESNAERALEALKEMSPDTAKVYRNGVLTAELPSKDLVPGDLIELHEGDKVPADVRVTFLNSLTLQLDQALLTGESMEVNKSLDSISESDATIQAKHNMLFSATAVKKGQCLCVVNSIGMNTEIGVIHASILSAGEVESSTPLKIKLDEFGELLTKVIGVICIFVWLINIKHFLSWEMDGMMPTNVVFSFTKCTYYFKIAVALAVAAIPEGLPAVITTCLALGTRKMAKKNAIVRKLPSVETLGCTTVICSDKTGTLTTNQMSAVTIVLPATSSDLRLLNVTGTTYNSADGEVEGVKGPLDASLLEFARVSTLCNECKVERTEEGLFKAIGQATEAALCVVSDKLIAAHQPNGGDAFDAASRFYKARFEKKAVLEFDRTRKRMSALCMSTEESMAVRSTRSSSNKGNTLVVKGQALSVLNQCTLVLLPSGEVAKMTPAFREKVLQTVEDLASRALRCLAMAYKPAESLGNLASYDGPNHPGHADLVHPELYNKVESDLTFVGIAGLLDPPRPEVRGAIEDCHQAGIRVIMITGDYKKTAEAICHQVGIFQASSEATGWASMTGSEFWNTEPAKQLEVLSQPGGCCFSGAQPNHKQLIVERLKQLNEIVAMTGDGVNDAPALKLADIGIAMGITGTEVAKEASDMVLADDNFSSIVAAVAEGRSIYNNMKAFIRYMISSNIGEVASIFITAAAGLPEGLIPVQLLWVNLVTDGPPATALGFNEADPDIMKKPPRKADENLISGWVFFRYMVVGLYVGFATVAGFVIWYTNTSFMGIDLSQDGHTPISLHQLTHWHQCSTWENFKPAPWTAGGERHVFDADPCSYFDEGKMKASTLSLSVLVAIEMFNAFNALSEDSSLLSVPPWTNPYLVIACFVSFGLHFVILYIPALAAMFGIVPLSFEEWQLVILLAFPVILIDEVLKFFGRIKSEAEFESRKLKTA